MRRLRSSSSGRLAQSGGGGRRIPTILVREKGEGGRGKKNKEKKEKRKEKKCEVRRRTSAKKPINCRLEATVVTNLA
jgi:hypothetical protein